MTEIRCPACQKVLSSPKALPRHTSCCTRWNEVIGVPPSQFDFNKHFGRGLWAPDQVENEDYVGCLLCAAQGKEIRVKRLSDHLKRVHDGMKRKEYEVQFPGAPVVARSSGVKRKKTTQKKYGVDNVGQSEKAKEKTKETARRKYGVDHHLKSTKVQRKRGRTNKERYGSENVFASKQVKAKIRRTMRDRYGFENPQQVPEIRRRTEHTTLERHGATSFLHSPARYAEIIRARNEREKERRDALIASGTYEICPHCDEVFTKVTSRHKAICQGWPDTEEPEPCLCGHESTSLTQMKRHRQVCVVWMLRDVEAVTRARYLRTMLTRWGVENPQQDSVTREKTRTTNKERYGAAELFSRDSDLYEKIQAALEGKRPILRGEDNPFAWPRVKEKVLRESLAKVGHEFPIYPTAAETVEDLVDRYGMTHPMQDRDFARMMLHAQSANREPNGPERIIQEMEPRLLYTGNRTFWRWLPRLGRHKNPDFVLPGPVSEHPFRDLRKVVEVNGDYWHSKDFTGVWPEQHEQELIEAYAEVGLDCLVVWESEVKSDPKSVGLRITEFLASTRV